MRSKNPAPQATRTEHEFQCTHEAGKIGSIRLATNQWRMNTTISQIASSFRFLCFVLPGQQLNLIRFLVLFPRVFHFFIVTVGCKDSLCSLVFNTHECLL